MSTQDTIKQYVVLRATTELWKIYQTDEYPYPKVQNYIARNLGFEALDKRFGVRALPSKAVSPDAAARNRAKAEPKKDVPTERVVVALDVFDPLAVREIQAAVERDRGKVFLGGGADLPFSGADHWCPSEASDPIFGNRFAAEKLLGVPYVRDRHKLTGRGVNVVVVDQGLDMDLLGRNYGGGWNVGGILPGASKGSVGATRRSHAMMVAHNILKVAPDATLFDLPMVPPRITDIQEFFLSTADAAYGKMFAGIAQYKLGSEFPGPWVIVNAWSVFDRKSEYPPGSYTNNPNHPFNLLVAQVVNDGNDVVFCAGNCGQFCPDPRCGGKDKGPGDSIFGANCHPSVLSVGAIRADMMWLGYSSQGPGQPLLGHDKPDLCAPSQFHETDDAYTTNGGTSAACALAGGVVAALRSKWPASKLPPEALKQILNDTARKTEGPRWNGRLGHGILNAHAAFDKVRATVP